MTAFKIRAKRPTGGHVELKLFVGPDLSHLALAGTLTMREEEAVDWIDMMTMSVSDDTVVLEHATIKQVDLPEPEWS